MRNFRPTVHVNLAMDFAVNLAMDFSWPFAASNKG